MAKEWAIASWRKGRSSVADNEEIGFKPNTISCNAAISSWEKSCDPSAGQRVELLLQKMLELYEAGSLNAKPKQ